MQSLTKIKFLFVDSDAIITKGIIALLIRVLNYQSPESIMSSKLNFINEIGLTSHLSPTSEWSSWYGKTNKGICHGV